jgi:broad specificity phosphatase PhoE
MELCLIRHGETVYNAEDRLQGKRDIALSPRGMIEAEQLGELLKAEGVVPRLLYSSPIARAVATARKLGMGIPIQTKPAFSSRSLGVLEGRSKSEIETLLPGTIDKLTHWDFCPPGGDETLEHLYTRANEEIENLVQVEARQKYLMIVTHSGVLEALVRGWFDVQPGEPLPFELKNAGAFIFLRAAHLWDYRRTIATGMASAAFDPS